MADIRRIAEAAWTGALRDGHGTIATGSGVLDDAGYSYGTRFEDGEGTNPEELIAAAHAACYSMALAAALARKRYSPQRIETRAICTLSPQSGGGFRITQLQLHTRADVPGIEDAEFLEIAQQAEGECPVSTALRGGPHIGLDAELL